MEPVGKPGKGKLGSKIGRLSWRNSAGPAEEKPLVHDWVSNHV